MGVGAIALVLQSNQIDNRGAFAVIGGALGWSFIYTGLYTWWRRPANRSGALMAGVGFTFFLNPLTFVHNGVILVVGQFVGTIAIAMLAHLVLAFPRGRLDSRYHRVLIACGYGCATLLQLPALLFFDTANSPDCRNCPANPLLVADNDQLYAFFKGLLNFAGFVVVVLVAWEIIRRARRTQGSERVLYVPVFRAGAAALGSFGLLFASAALSGPGAAVLQLLGFLLFLSVPFAFMAGLLRGRLSRADAVSRLVEDLGHSGGEERSLRDAMATALGDPSLSLAYWIATRAHYVDAQGVPIQLPEPGSGRAATPVEREGRRVAVIIWDESLAEDEGLVRAAGAAASMALENERLTAELRARVEELRSSRARIVRAADDERRRLERDLHDGAQQRLVALALNLRLARASFDSDPEGATELLDDAIQELTEATAELRELARGIHPAILTDRGLEAAVMALASRATIPVELGELPEERLSPPVESTAYFVVAESLTNVARYAKATHAEVDIRRDNGKLVVEVRDDGCGGADPTRGSGLRGLADRVGAVDGRIEVESPAGAGTTVHAEIPCQR
jgi:signal transduction histidine kinase